MNRQIKIYNSIIAATVILTFVAGCGKKNIENMSPKEIMTLYYMSRESGDAETLRKIIIFPHSMTEEEIFKKLQLTVTCDSEKFAMKATLSRIKVEYEKIIDQNTAEVGVVIKGGIWPFLKRIPSQQIMLKKDNGIWKYHYNKFELTEQQLQDTIRENPNDPDLYYLLGSKIQPENTARAMKYYKKYHDLCPNGFWIDSNREKLFRGIDDYKKEEQKILVGLAKLPPTMGKDEGYRELGQLVMEGGDYEKAKMYFQKAEEELKRSPSALGRERLAKARRELEALIKQQEEDKTNNNSDTISLH